jgi:exopolysaccharide biosynthesis polyprenyl glycosylphosphotransferase
MKIGEDIVMDSIKIHNPSIPVYGQTEVLVDHGSSDIIYKFIKSIPPLWAQRIEWFFNKRWRSTLILMGFDFVGAWLGIFVAVFYSNIFFGINEPFIYYSYPWISYIIFIFGYIYLKNGYSQIKDRRPEEELAVVVIGNVLAIAFTLTANFIIRKEMVFSRHILLLGFISSLGFMLILRFVVREILRKLWQYGLARENVIIVGYSAKNVRWLLEHLRIQRYNGFNIIGYLSRKVLGLKNNISYVGGIDKLSEIVASKKIDKVFFALDEYNDESHQILISKLEECGRHKIPAMIISHVFNEFHFSLHTEGYSGTFAINRRVPSHSKFLFRVIKRLIDIIGSLFFLITTLPLWLGVIVVIKVRDRGPIFFKHRLVGKNGKIFYALKFRTMVINAQDIINDNPKLLEEFKKNYKLKNDPRITPFGKWLRRTSLDEIPQFVNILKGEMSLVGPRPVREDEIDLYGEFKHERSKMRPGLSGFWQVSGRCNTTYEDRVAMDKFYLYKCNIWLDLVILLRTPLRVLRGDGAC